MAKANIANDNGVDVSTNIPAPVAKTRSELLAETRSRQWSDKYVVTRRFSEKSAMYGWKLQDASANTVLAAANGDDEAFSALCKKDKLIAGEFIEGDLCFPKRAK